MTLHKTDNRSVLGAINDNISHVTHHAGVDGGVEVIGLAKLTAHVNNMPISSLEWAYAINKFRQTIFHSVD